MCHAMNNNTGWEVGLCYLVLIPGRNKDLTISGVTKLQRKHFLLSYFNISKLFTAVLGLNSKVKWNQNQSVAMIFNLVSANIALNKSALLWAPIIPWQQANTQTTELTGQQLTSINLNISQIWTNSHHGWRTCWRRLQCSVQHAQDITWLAMWSQICCWHRYLTCIFRLLWG